MKMHLRNSRLFVNAGMDFPECYAYQDLLDLDKGRLPTTNEIDGVTCMNCLRSVAKQHWNQVTRSQAGARLGRIRES